MHSFIFLSSFRASSPRVKIRILIITLNHHLFSPVFIFAFIYSPVSNDFIFMRRFINVEVESSFKKKKKEYIYIISSKGCGRKFISTLNINSLRVQYRIFLTPLSPMAPVLHFKRVFNRFTRCNTKGKRRC